MYEILCDTCGRLGVHASRTGAESWAERHVENANHDCRVDVIESA